MKSFKVRTLKSDVTCAACGNHVFFVKTRSICNAYRLVNVVVVVDDDDVDVIVNVEGL